MPPPALLLANQHLPRQNPPAPAPAPAPNVAQRRGKTIRVLSKALLKRIIDYEADIQRVQGRAVDLIQEEVDNIVVALLRATPAERQAWEPKQAGMEYGPKLSSLKIKALAREKNLQVPRGNLFKRLKAVAVDSLIDRLQTSGQLARHSRRKTIQARDFSEANNVCKAYND